MTMFNSSYSEGNIGGNQLLDGSISLSPLYPSSLRASIRVSPDFTLLRHSSPSFGSVQHCLNSNLSPKIKVGRLCKYPNCYFHYAYRFATHTLAIVDDSLVRVSRRVEKNHFANVVEWQCYTSSQLSLKHFESPTSSPHDYGAIKTKRAPKSE